MQIGPGQRFSVLLHTKTEPPRDQYFLQLETRDFGGVTRSFAVINYDTQPNDPAPQFYPPPPKSPPLTLPPTDTSFLDYQLRPLQSGDSTKSDFPTAKDVTRRVNITYHLSIPNGELIYLINGYTWNEGVVEVPYLVALYENDEAEWPSMERAIANDGLDPVTKSFPAQVGEVLEIVIQGTGSAGNGTETHPWHAHGAHYYDLGGGPGVYDADANEAKWLTSPGEPVKRE